MADKRMDNGRDDTTRNGRGTVPDNGTPGMLGGDVATRGTDVVRRADVSPPGSRERSESDVTGYSPDRDEAPSVRQGRFHRAAALRLAQPRTSTDVGTGVGTGLGTGSGMGMSGMGTGAGLNTRGTWGSSGTPQQGPYGRDDRDDRSAIGSGGGQMRMGEQDTRHSLEMRRDTGGENYRQWDRTGFGGEDRGQHGTQGHPGMGTQGQRSDRYDPMLGMSQASPGRPGSGVNIGMGETYASRGPDTDTSRPEHKGMLAGLRRRWQREPLTAREIMTRGVKTVRQDSSLREVAQLMKDEDCGVVPIVDSRGCLVGIITDRDLVIRAFTGGRTPDQLRAGDVMTDDVECVHPDEDIHSIISLMGKRQIRRIPVVERDDRVIGIISMGDIANRADYDEELQEALDRISSKRSFWSRLT
ncbi:CBS domain-containing protein [Hyalangium minutum]|uniref:CBS domain protein n=1 Tax=Hyalangium minutum TaxID=394096 RepID=A0A085WLU7_9BACT|nr:CBS domain-containing protein [Hyalangium minutum]KFE68660.1 CBS domain protein [Hyalangium minutum]